MNPGVFGFESLGSFRSDGDYAGIGFNFGVNPIANQLDTIDFPEEHPLSSQESSMFLGSDGYIFAKIELLPDATNDSLTTEIIISGDDNLIPISIFQEFSIIEGINPRVILFVNYLDWFAEIDILNDTPSAMSEKIASRITNSFELVEIQSR